MINDWKASIQLIASPEMDPETVASPKPKAARFAFWLSVGAVVLLAIGVGVWQMTSVSLAAKGTSQRSFVIDTEFDKFRKIMVRKNATAAIIAHSGMQLLDEQLQGVAIDTTEDDRPILNALRGKSQADLAATKQIVVSLKDPALNADRLSLTQQANIELDRLHVRTTASQAAGNLEAYETTLTAVPDGDKTKVSLTIDQIVRVTVPKLFQSQAESRVQEAADKATREQEKAIQQFVAQFANQAIILPKFGASKE